MTVFPKFARVRDNPSVTKLIKNLDNKILFLSNIEFFYLKIFNQNNFIEHKMWIFDHTLFYFDYRTLQNTTFE